MVKKKIKQNKNEVFEKIVLYSLVIIFAFYLLASFSFAIAADSSEVQSVPVSPANVSDILVYAYSSNWYTGVYSTTTSYSGVAVTVNYIPYFISDEQFTIQFTQRPSWGMGGSTQVNSTYSSDYELYYGTAGTYNVQSATSYVSNYSSLNEALSAVSGVINNGGSTSSNAILIPSTNFSFIGINVNNASIYLRSTYENNAAVALYHDTSSGGYIPYILCKNDYGVFSTIDNTETALLSTPVVIDGVTYYEKYDTSSSFIVFDPAESLGYFNSMSDAQNACVNLLDISWPAQGEANFNYNLPAGNVAFIELTDRSTSYQLLCDFNYLSYASDPPWPYNGMKIGYVLDLPEADESFPFNGWNDITWIKSPTGQNLMGQTTLGIAQGSLDYTRGYFVIYVPFWGTGSVGNNSNINFNLDGGIWQNTSVTISIPFVSGITVYGLDTTVSFADGVISTDTSGNGDVYTRDMTNQTDNVFTDSDGNIVNIPSGGGSNSNPISNFWSWLNTQFESLKSLFSTGHNTIQTLVGYGSTFMNKVASLYQWLPAPVYSVLVAGLSLVIIIGVVKVFL